MTPRGFSLHVGLDTWNLDAIPLTDMPPPVGGRAAAAAMRAIAQERNFTQSLVLRDAKATFTGVSDALADLSDQLADGDLFLISLAGHARLTGERAGAPHQEFLLYDRWWRDDEIFSMLSHVRRSARVLLVLEACYARGLLLPGIESYDLWRSVQSVFGSYMLRSQVTRTVLLDNFLQSPKGWSRVVASAPKAVSGAPTADILLLAACSNLLRAPAASHPSAPDSLPPFTKAVVDLWRSSSDYYDLTRRIASAVSTPEPELITKLSKPAPNGGKPFPEQPPFSV